MDEPRVKTDCHIWAVFRFHHCPGCGLCEDFHEQGALWILNRHCVLVHVPLFCFVMAGFVIAHCSVASPNAVFKSNEHLENVFPFKIISFYYCSEAHKFTQYYVSTSLFHLQDFFLSFIKCALKQLLQNIILDQFTVMSNWVDERKNPSAESVCFRRKISKIHFLGISAIEWHSFLFPL